jgi:HEAT repeat protein
VRTVPPIRYVPLLGTEKKVSTPTVLARALRDPDVGVRAQAVKLLGILGQSKSGKVKREVAEVLGMATRDRDPGIRLLAIERLGEMEERYGNKHLMAALHDPNPFVREKVMVVLSGRQDRAAAAAASPTATSPADSAAAP